MRTHYLITASRPALIVSVERGKIAHHIVIDPGAPLPAIERGRRATEVLGYFLAEDYRVEQVSDEEAIRYSRSRGEVEQLDDLIGLTNEELDRRIRIATEMALYDIAAMAKAPCVSAQLGRHEEVARLMRSIARCQKAREHSQPGARQ